jgi:hypothetical protein
MKEQIMPKKRRPIESINANPPNNVKSLFVVIE